MTLHARPTTDFNWYRREGEGWEMWVRNGFGGNWIGVNPDADTLRKLAVLTLVETGKSRDIVCVEGVGVAQTLHPSNSNPWIAAGVLKNEQR